MILEHEPQGAVRFTSPGATLRASWGPPPQPSEDPIMWTGPGFAQQKLSAGWLPGHLQALACPRLVPHKLLWDPHISAAEPSPSPPYCAPFQGSHQN